MHVTVFLDFDWSVASNHRFSLVEILLNYLKVHCLVIIIKGMVRLHRVAGEKSKNLCWVQLCQALYKFDFNPLLSKKNTLKSNKFDVGQTVFYA